MLESTGNTNWKVNGDSLRKGMQEDVLYMELKISLSFYYQYQLTSCSFRILTAEYTKKKRFIFTQDVSAGYLILH